MKFPNRGEDPWAWWQPLKLRMEIRKHMTPMTPDQANSKRLMVSTLYVFAAAAFFHIFAFRYGVADSNPDPQAVALQHLNRGKLVEMENFRIKKVVDYKSEDFDSKIKRTNKPTAILE